MENENNIKQILEAPIHNHNMNSIKFNNLNQLKGNYKWMWTEMILNELKKTFNE
jgi:hypothetical protein